MKLEANQIGVAIQSRRIVHDVTLTIAPGEMVGLIGPNGSGKSTFLRTVYRMVKPIAGRVVLGGDNIWQLSARQAAQRTGVVVQETPADFEFTVREVVTMGRTPHKGMFAQDTEQDEQIVDHALERVGVAGFAARTYNTLSGGEKQRVLVARTLAQQPKLLVLDEPTNHLDIRYQLEILNLVRSLGITTLVTLHDLNLAAAYCGHLYLLAAGRIVADGTPEEVLTPPRVREVFGVEAVCGQHPITGRLHLSFVAMDSGLLNQEQATGLPANAPMGYRRAE